MNRNPMISSLSLLLLFSAPLRAEVHPNDPPSYLTRIEVNKVLKEVKPGRLYLRICETCPGGPVTVYRMTKAEVHEDYELEVRIIGQELAQSEKVHRLVDKNGKYFWTGMDEDDETLNPIEFYFETDSNIFRRVDGLLGIRKSKSRKTFALPMAFYRQVKGRFDPMDATQLEIIGKHLGRWSLAKAEGGGGSVLPRISGYRECHEDYQFIEVSGKKESGFQIRIMDKKGNPETVFRIAQVEALKPDGYRFLGTTSAGIVRWASVVPDLHSDYMMNPDKTMNTLARQKPAIFAAGFFTWDFPATWGPNLGIGTAHFAPESKARSLSAVDGMECKGK